MSGANGETFASMLDVPTAEHREKRQKGGELTEEENGENQRISRKRIRIENIHAKMEVSKILAQKYRNRRNCRNLRRNIICGMINFATRM